MTKLRRVVDAVGLCLLFVVVGVLAAWDMAVRAIRGKSA